MQAAGQWMATGAGEGDAGSGRWCSSDSFCPLPPPDCFSWAERLMESKFIPCLWYQLEERWQQHNARPVDTFTNKWISGRCWRCCRCSCLRPIHQSNKWREWIMYKRLQLSIISYGKVNFMNSPIILIIISDWMIVPETDAERSEVSHHLPLSIPTTAEHQQR